MAKKKKLTRMELAIRVAKKTGASQRKSYALVNVVLEQLAASLEKGESAELRGFGVFSVVKRKKKRVAVPKGGGIVTIPARKEVRFVAGKGLKERINKGR